MKNIVYRSGQAMVTLLIFVVMSLIITSAAVAFTVNSIQSVLHIEQSDMALTLAEAGVENAILRLLRDPNYVGEDLNLDGQQVNIVVTGSNPYQITASVTYNNYVKQLQVEVERIDGVLNINSWKQI